ncbi:acyltransferase family protein [Ruania halotolerans]|uniref:acyltransferase family protein n=1 Tax=Ruania halotolerans TaxID=2897773 RepID=UPI001E5E3197|nr:acyltransferase [Ruania halotolerans]
MRAVAAILVAVFHIWVGRVSGAVDVFFVVAGFLITTSLLRQVEGTGRVRVGQYFSRLARRLLPLASVVLVVVAVLAPLLLPGTRLRATFAEIAASAVYLENWALAAKSVDYLARDDAPSPVQHFWAMSVQGQFYLLWLLLVLVALHWGVRHLRRRLAVLMGALLVASLTWSVLLTNANQPLAYFHTGARVWEFAAGGLVALALAAGPRIAGRAGVITGWLGLAMIVSTGTLLPVSTAFPGWVAAWPVAGAVLVLLSGASTGGVQRLLGSRPLAWLGRYSYGLYLWHWPLLAFLLAHTGQSTAGIGAGLAIITAALVLSVLSTTLVETPIRTRLPLGPWRTVAAGAVVMLVLAATATGLGRAGNTSATAEPNHNIADHPGAAVLNDPDIRADADVAPYPALEDATKDKAAVYADECHQGQGTAEVRTCSYGNTEGDFTVYLVGGSHSAHWFPALETVATDNRWHLVSITKSACLFSTDPPGSGDELEYCRAWNDNVVELIENNPPDLLVMTSTRGAGEAEQVPAGYPERWAEMGALGIPVFAIRDTPWWPSSPLDCIAQHGAHSDRCAAPRTDFFATTDPTAGLADPPANVHFADLNDYICAPNLCEPVVGNVVVYYDNSHLTATYSRSLAPMLADALADAGYGLSGEA